MAKKKTKEKTGPQQVSVFGSTQAYGIYGHLGDDRRRLTWGARVREMQVEPTIAMLQYKYVSAIARPGFSIEATKDVPPDVKEFARKQMEKHYDGFVRTAGIGCLNWGWQGYEKVHEPNAKGHIVIKKLKPLLHDMTSIEVYEDNGDWAGFSQSNVELETSESVLVSFDVEGTNWYGRAPMRNLVRPYDQKQKIEKRAEEYDGRVAAAHWVVYFPSGTSKKIGADGQPVVVDGIAQRVDNREIALNVLTALLNTGSAVLPTEIQSEMQELNAATGKESWRVELLTAARQGGTAPYDSRLRYKDVEFARALGFPERTVFEGQHGTKADAESHADGSSNGPEDRAKTIATVLCDQVLDDLIAWNFGEEYRGEVKVRANPMTDKQKAYLKSIYGQLLGNQEIAAAEYDSFDMDAIADQINIPREKRGEDPDLSELEDDDELELSLSECGAGSGVGGGFGKGNTCASGGGVSENKFNVQAVVDALDSYSSWSSDYDTYNSDDPPEGMDDPGDGWSQLDAINNAVKNELSKIKGVTDIDSDYQSSSSYWDVYFRNADGEDDSVQVRVSNHGQRYAGPVWSFEAGDDAKSVKRGFDSINKAIQEARGDNDLELSECGANAQGGGGFQKGNTCAQKNKKTSALQSRKASLRAYAESQAEPHVVWPSDTSKLSDDEFDRLVAADEARGRRVRDSRNALIAEIREDLVGETPEETIDNIESYNRIAGEDSELSIHEESMINSLRQEAKESIRQAEVRKNQIALRQAMNDVIGSADESVYESPFQLQHEQGFITGNDDDISYASQNIGFGEDYDEAKEIASLGGMIEGASATVNADDAMDSISISIDDGFSASRTINYDSEGDIVIKNNSLVVYETGNGLGTEILSKQVSHAIKAGVSRIETYAVRGADTNGYYTWPRLGYDADIPPNVTLPDRFSDVTRLSQLMMTPEGRDWWKDNGVSTYMEFDLEEGSLSRKVFAAYLKRKGY